VVARIGAADPREVFCNYQGTMLGLGVVWARPNAEGELGVITINRGRE
jgi:hypothetical protein